MKEKQMYIPGEEDLWLQVVKLHHDTLVAGHPSYEKMIELLQRTYFWPGMTSFIKDYISRCDRCARFKGMNQAPFGTLNLLDAHTEITHSYVPRIGIEQHVLKAPSADELANEMAKVLDETRCNIIEAQGWMKTQADKHHMEAPDYKVGDKVWLSTMNLRLIRTSKKLSKRWIGPYVITKLVGNNAVELKLPQSIKIYPVMNLLWVKSYKERLPGQPLQKPGPITVTEDRDIEYKVNYIIDSYWKGKWLEYLVHWSGFNKEDHIWELEGQLDNTHDIIIDFHWENPSALRKLRMSYIDFLGLFKPYENNTIAHDKDAPFDCLEVDP